MKKIILVFLVGILILAAGCSGGNTAATSSTSASTVNPTTSTAAVTTSAVSTSAAAVTSTTVATTTSKSAAPAELISIKVGSLPRIYDIIAFAAQEENLYEKYGIEVEIVSFRSETEKDNAMFAGQLDGVIEGTFGAININKNEQTCQLVGHSLMSRMFELIASSASGVTDASQLVGKNVATSVGTIMEYALERLLASQGVSMKDVTIMNIPSMPMRLEALNQGEVAAALFTSPLSDQAVATGNLKLADDSQQQFGGPGLIFSLEALQNKPEGIAGFVSAWQEAVRMINADPEKYRSLIVSFAKVPESLADTYVIPVFPELRLPTDEEFATLNNWMLENGFITEAVPYDRVVNTDFIK